MPESGRCWPISGGHPRGGGYSLCDGWYICAAVLTPFFHFGRIEHDLFGVLFLIHQQQSYLLGYKNYQFLQKSIFLAPNSIFSSIFLGPIFSGQRHTPIRFQAEYPPPRGAILVCKMSYHHEFSQSLEIAGLYFTRLMISYECHEFGRHLGSRAAET